ncbi:MAG: Protein PafC [Acidimicrobiales bacterium]|nr:MAG: WYL domain-containing protein [Actinomycetota bacterium]MBV6509417.1 Protein PafC [Acidimicrobiales bacterium]RIK06736.1 MAG: hypothetical protein DCC48_05805 [Acidobacteriota bacterium]
MRHPVEDRLERLLAILAYLAEHGSARLDDLASLYRVTRHQLETDLRLAMYVGVPPYDLPGETPEIHLDGDTVSAWVPEHFSHPPRLNRAEAFAVLTIGRAALELNPGLGRLRSALDKVEEALEIGSGVDVAIDEPAALEHFREACADRRRLEIVYWSAWRDELTTRQVDPFQVFYAEGAWYAVCADDSSGSIRRFRLDRVERCRDTGVTFEPVPGAGSLGLEVFDPPEDVTTVQLRLPPSARWVTDYVGVRLVEAGDDHLVVELGAVGVVWLERLLLRTGGEVVEPEELRGLTGEVARRVLARYG